MPAPAGREEGGDAGAAGAHPLGERALRDELDLELAGQELPLELLVLADVGGDHLPDLAVCSRMPEAAVVDAAVVGDDGQVLRRRCADERRDRVLGDAAEAEAADDERRAVEDVLTASSAEATTLSIIGPRS